MHLAERKEVNLKLLLIADAIAIVVLDKKKLISGSFLNNVDVIAVAVQTIDIIHNQPHNSG